MSSSNLIRWGGLAAMLGGMLWIIGAVIHASKPRGCVAEECAFRPMRESGALDGILTLLSLLLFAVGVMGLVILARSAGRFGKMGKAGVVIAAKGHRLDWLEHLVHDPCSQGLRQWPGAENPPVGGTGRRRPCLLGPEGGVTPSPPRKSRSQRASQTRRRPARLQPGWRTSEPRSAGEPSSAPACCSAR